MIKMHIVRAVLCLVAIGAVVACSSGGGDSSSPTTGVGATISGVASKGPLKGATVTIYALDAAGVQGAVLATASTETNGAYTANIGSYTGSILSVVSGGTYTNEASLSSVSNTMQLRAAVPNVTVSVSVIVTPLTEIAVRKAGALTPGNIASANVLVSNMIGGINIITTTPADVLVSSSTNTNEKNYGLMLAAISQMVSDGTATTVSDAITQITNGLSSNGQLDTTTGAAISTSLNNFINSANNNTGLTTSTAAIVSSVNAATAAEFPIAATSGKEMSISAAFDGTNYLVGIQDVIPDSSQLSGFRSTIIAQLVSGSTGSLVGSQIALNKTGGAPSVAFDGTNYLMTWPDRVPSSDPNVWVWELFGQRISKTGQLVGATFTIAEIGYHDGGPIIFDGSNYFAVWEARSNSNSGDTADVYGQFISPSGSLLGSVIPVSTALHGQRMPAVAFDGTNILVAWTDSRNLSSCSTDTQGTHCAESDIYGQLIAKSSASTAGSLTGGNFLINASSLPRDGNGVSVAFDGTNYFVVILEETTLPNACPTSGCKWDLYGQFVTKAGVPAGSKVTISNTAPDHHLQQVVWNGTKYLATWIENFGTTTTSVKGRYFDTSGAPLGSELNLFSAGTNGVVPWYVTPIVNGTNYFMIVNRGIPGADPFNFDAYTSQDVFGAFITP